MKRPKISDVAMLAGVSNATVSYVINNGPRMVSEKTRQRVNEAIETLGYYPYVAARNMRKGNTQTVGFLVQSLISPFVSALVNSIEKYLTKNNYHLILASAHEDHKREAYMLNALANQSIDGLLYIPTSSINGVFINRLIQNGLPVVLVDRKINDVSADLVMTDNFSAAKKATDYLIKNDCKHIMCISFSEEASSAIDRVEGYRSALIERNLPFDDRYILIHQYTLEEKIEEKFMEKISQIGLPDGIICMTDSIFIDIIKVLKKMGVNVPNQVHVTGSFYNSPWNALIEPPLPVVNQNHELIAKYSVQFLLERINGFNQDPRTKLVEAEYINM